MRKKNKEYFRKIKFLVLDFDGVMTDNKVYVNENGKEMVCCSRSDGLGLEMIGKKGVEVLIISKEKNNVVRKRSKKLGIKCIQGVNNKVAVLKREINARRFGRKDVCYIGNDINDYECIKFAGIGVAVRDSHKKLYKVADYITLNKGGNGAVHEICELIC